MPHLSHSLRLEGLERWVVNLTDWTLTPAQEDVLKLGLNFVPAPSKLPLTDTKATVESGAMHEVDTGGC